MQRVGEEAKQPGKQNDPQCQDVKRASEQRAPSFRGSSRMLDSVCTPATILYVQPKVRETRSVHRRESAQNATVYFQNMTRRGIDSLENIASRAGPLVEQD